MTTPEEFIIVITSYSIHYTKLYDADSLGLRPVANLCPLADETRRERVREILAGIYEREPGAKQSIFAALANVRKGYML